jgi:type II secretory pathway component HofQ
MGFSKGALMRHYPLVAVVFVLVIPPAANGADEKPIRTCPAAKQISLSMQNVPVGVFLREVASQGQVNIAVSPYLRGSVSATLHCVDARQALRLVLGQIDAAYCDEGTVLRVDERSRSRCTHPQPAVERARTGRGTPLAL